MRAWLILGLLLALLTTARRASQAEDAHRNQLVRVVTVSQDGLDDAPGKPLLDATLTILDRSASFRPDIVCLPETFTRGEPESVPGPTTNRLAQWAKQHSCYVICPIATRFKDRVFNSAILLDRDGNVVGRYDKIRPTEGELE